MAYRKYGISGGRLAAVKEMAKGFKVEHLGLPNNDCVNCMIEPKKDGFIVASIFTVKWTVELIMFNINNQGSINNPQIIHPYPPEMVNINAYSNLTYASPILYSLLRTSITALICINLSTLDYINIFNIPVDTDNTWIVEYTGILMYHSDTGIVHYDRHAPLRADILPRVILPYSPAQGKEYLLHAVNMMIGAGKDRFIAIEGNKNILTLRIDRLGEMRIVKRKAMGRILNGNEFKKLMRKAGIREIERRKEEGEGKDAIEEDMKEIYESKFMLCKENLMVTFDNCLIVQLEHELSTFQNPSLRILCLLDSKHLLIKNLHITKFRQISSMTHFTHNSLPLVSLSSPSGQYSLFTVSRSIIMHIYSMPDDENMQIYGDLYRGEDGEILVYGVDAAYRIRL